MNASTKKIALIVGIVLGATFVITGTYMIAESGKKTTDIEKSANIESPVDDTQGSQGIDTLDTSTNASGDEKLKSEPDVSEEEKAKDDVVDVEQDVEAEGNSKDDLVDDGAKDTAGSDDDNYYYDDNPLSLWDYFG